MEKETVELEVKVTRTMRVSIQVSKQHKLNIEDYIDQEIDDNESEILEQVREKLEIEDCDIDLT